jgi:acetoin utilization deacetylase AcuC-like enzyme
MNLWTRRQFALSLATLPAFAGSYAQDLFSPAGKQPTGFMYDPAFLRHDVPHLHPECPARLTAIIDEMKRTSLDQRIQSLNIDVDALPYLPLVHSVEQIRKIRAMPITGDVATKAVSGALSAVKAVCVGSLRNAFCALRPPGHHARNTGQEEGFCYFNNVAIAARYAQKVHGIKRIAIIDWDCHHGNGTEEAFYEDGSVLYFSTHNRHAYPGTGDPKRTGKGAHRGLNINVHLPCGAGDRDFYRVWDEKLMPAADRFKPDLVLISAGFDARENDPLGCFKMSDIGFIELTKRAMLIADRYAGGRLVSVLEGGYNINGLGKAACAHLSALAGIV